MNDAEWRELPSLLCVAKAQADGWEIQVNTGTTWEEWKGKAWMNHMDYQGRPRQPAMKKVKSLCWRNVDGFLTWRCEHTPVNAENWTRFPAGDIEGEVPA